MTSYFRPSPARSSNWKLFGVAALTLFDVCIVAYLIAELWRIWK